MASLGRWIAIALLVAPGTTLAQATSDPDAASASSPASLAVVYDGSGFSNLAGGVRRGAAYVGTLNVGLSLDGSRLFRTPGLTAYADVVWIHGGAPDGFAGDAQGVSNLTGPATVRVEEAWFQLNVLGNRLSVLAGRYDLNTEFYRTQSAGLFVNSSFGVGPEFSASGQAGPSIFPSTSIGVRVAVKPSPNIVVRTAAFDGVPVDRADGVVAVFRPGDGVLLLSEVAFLSRPTATEHRPRKMRFRIGRSSGLPPYDAKVAVGGWYYTATFPDLSQVAANGDPVLHSGSGGVYAVADTVLAGAHAADDGRRLTAFAEAGLGDQRVTRFRAHAVAGLVASGLVPNRTSDEFGVAVAWAQNGSHFAQIQEQAGVATGHAETVIEVTSLWQLTSWLAVQPDFQYIVRPDTLPSTPNAACVQLRFEARF